MNILLGVQHITDSIWVGTDRSLYLALQGFATIQANIQAGVYQMQDQPEEEVPYNFSMQGDIGVVSIRGSLVNSTSTWARYSNMTTYNDIRKAMVYAANDPKVKAILMDIESGGGAVSGVSDTAELIKSIDANVKPVYSFTDGVMASAAIWLGASGRELHNSKTAVVGSVGVLSTHMEMSKMFKEMGIGVTVLREGEFKALANQFEPLSDKGKEQIQTQLKGTYGVFAGHMAEQRKMSLETFDRRAGQGREFLGGDAVTAGLSDSVTTFDALMSKIQSRIDTSAKKEQNAQSFQRGPQMTKTALTEQQIAAMAAGAGAQAGEVTPPATPAAPAPTETPAAPAPVAAAPGAAATATLVNPSEAVVTLLKGQLTEAQANVTTLSVENASLKGKLASVETTHTGLTKIAAISLRNMKVALGFSGVDFSAMSPEQLLVEHDATSKQFAEKFKTGGVAATTTETVETKDTGLSVAQRRILATNRIPTRK